MLVGVRDARGHLKHMVGTLRSFDHFGTIVLEGASERIVRGGAYAERRRGLCVVRGENVFMVAEIDPARDDALLAGLRRAEYAELEAAEAAALGRSL